MIADIRKAIELLKLPDLLADILDDAGKESANCLFDLGLLEKEEITHGIQVFDVEMEDIGNGSLNWFLGYQTNSKFRPKIRLMDIEVIDLYVFNKVKPNSITWGTAFGVWLCKWRDASNAEELKKQKTNLHFTAIGVVKIIELIAKAAVTTIAIVDDKDKLVFHVIGGKLPKPLKITIHQDAFV